MNCPCCNTKSTNPKINLDYPLSLIKFMTTNYIVLNQLSSGVG